jgi:hypothetical protein
MALPNIADTWRVTLQHHTTAWFGVVCINVKAPTGDAEDIAGELAQAWWADGSMCEALSGEVTGGDVTAQPYDGSSGAEVFALGSLGTDQTVGQNSGHPEAPQVCGLLTWRTQVATRSGRGRTYVPGISEAIVDSEKGKIDVGQQSNWQGWATAFWGNATGGTHIADIVVVSMKHENSLVVSGVVARPYLGSQRRRAARLA